MMNWPGYGPFGWGSTESSIESTTMSRQSIFYWLDPGGTSTKSSEIGSFGRRPNRNRRFPTSEGKKRITEHRSREPSSRGRRPFHQCQIPDISPGIRYLVDKRPYGKAAIQEPSSSHFFLSCSSRPVPSKALMISQRMSASKPSRSRYPVSTFGSFFSATRLSGLLAVLDTPSSIVRTWRSRFGTGISIPASRVASRTATCSSLDTTR